MVTSKRFARHLTHDTTKEDEEQQQQQSRINNQQSTLTNQQSKWEQQKQVVLQSRRKCGVLDESPILNDNGETLSSEVLVLNHEAQTTVIFYLFGSKVYIILLWILKKKVWKNKQVEVNFEPL